MENESVSLFTREWIEMQNRYCRYDNINVSLFTREWIEIKSEFVDDYSAESLPLYEGVD